MVYSITRTANSREVAVRSLYNDTDSSALFQSSDYLNTPLQVSQNLGVNNMYTKT